MNEFTYCFLEGLHRGVQKWAAADWRAKAEAMGQKALQWGQTPEGIGTLAGAGIGGTAGALVDKEHRVRGGILGALLGGGAGYGGGAALSANRRKRTAEREFELHPTSQARTDDYPDRKQVTESLREMGFKSEKADRHSELMDLLRRAESAGREDVAKSIRQELKEFDYENGITRSMLPPRPTIDMPNRF